MVPDSGTTRLLAELGVAFLLFTLGLEFSLPRMLAMRREVFGLGALQVLATTAAFALPRPALLGLPWLTAIVLGGAVAMSSTAILLQQLTERAELNRTHGRLAFAMLLFQDLAFVPFLALGACWPPARIASDSGESALTVIGGALAIVAVLAAGRWLLRPLFHEIAHSRLRELFTLAVLLVVLASAWVSHLAGLSFALGAFLAGMMLAETEYRHQIEAVIRPFRDILLGLFFISVGMLLDVRLLARPSGLGVVLLMLLTLVTLKAAIAGVVTRPFTNSRFKALRTGIVMAIGGEFGIALCTMLLQAGLVPAASGQPLVVAIVLSMVLSPLILSNNKRVARWLLREQAPPTTASEREQSATAADRAARARHPLRLRARRPERGARARGAGLRVHRSRPRPGAHPRGAPGGRPGDVRRFGGRGDARQGGYRDRQRAGHQLLRSRHLARHSAQRAARCARSCRCWCAPRTTRGSRSCRMRAPPTWCPRPSRRA